MVSQTVLGFKNLGEAKNPADLLASIPIEAVVTSRGPPGSDVSTVDLGANAKSSRTEALHQQLLSAIAPESVTTKSGPGLGVTVREKSE